MNGGANEGEANRRGVIGERNGWHAWLHNDKRDGGKTETAVLSGGSALHVQQLNYERDVG